MTQGVERFYNSLAEVYHLIFADWDEAMDRQARVIDTLLGARLGAGRLRIHDCACGIGTQAIGLAGLGHRVSASDVSRAAIGRAVREAAQRGRSIEFRAADMTRMAAFPDHQFDVVGAFDNALPHLSAAQLLEAFYEFRRLLRTGGLFIASIRDYDELIQTRPETQGPFFFGPHGQRRIVHQVWDWTDADRYDVHQFITIERERKWETLHFASEYRCLLRGEVNAAIHATGFREAEWIMPAQSRYYQPIVIAVAL